MNNLLTFEEALSALREGKYVGIENHLCYFEPMINNGQLLGIIVHDEEGDEYNCEEFHIDEVLATNWIVIE